MKITFCFYTWVLIFIIKPRNLKQFLNSLYSSQLFSYPSVSLGNSPHANLDLVLKHYYNPFFFFYWNNLNLIFKLRWLNSNVIEFLPGEFLNHFNRKNGNCQLNSIHEKGQFLLLVKDNAEFCNYYIKRAWKWVWKVSLQDQPLLYQNINE